MASGQRQTYYFKNLNAIKEIAKEENFEVNGSTFEELFWDKYAGTDETFKSKLKALYSGEQTLKEFIISVLETMAYNTSYMKKDNIEFIKAVREVVGTASWFAPADNYTDFRLDNRKAKLDNIADILSAIISELEHRSNIVKKPIFNSMKPWEIDVQDSRYADILKDESNYQESKIAEFKMKEAKLRASFTDDITPGKALDLIIEYWDYMWNFSSVYEAVEYCITLSENLNNKPLIRRKMRTFFINQSAQQAVINSAVEHVINGIQPTPATLNRLLAYAERLRK